jgi:serine phosphatase RsbU (regulator of sigma subunit)/anti-sigma regulatory factor (Ser/Thr protein kinase)
LFFMLRVDGSISYAGDQLRAFLGLAPEDPLSKIVECIDRRDVVRFRRRLQFSGGADIEERLRVRAARGDVHECRVYATHVCGPESRSHWLGFCHVVGAVADRGTALGSERDVNLHDLMSGNDCVELLSLDERLWAMSMNGTQMPEPTTSITGFWSEFWNERERPAAIRALDEARAGRVGRFEGSISTGADSATWWDVVITPILDPNGRPEGLLVISHDITHTKRLEEQLRFLAQSSKVLGSSLEIEQTLGTIARLAVPALASWCMITWRAGGSTSAVTFAGPNEPLQRALEALTPHRWRKEAVFLPTISADALTRLAQEDEHFARLQTLSARSLAIVPLVCRDEILGSVSLGTLERTLTSRDLEFVEELASRIAMAVDNARLFAHERRVARMLQAALLPDDVPHLRDVALSTWYVSGALEADVGGDWYDAFVLPDGRLAMSIGDVCGSGLRAAVRMSALRQSIRAIARSVLDPATVLDCIDAQLKLDAPGALATSALIVFDPRTQQLEYALAGHPRPLIHTPDGDVLELGGTGLPLGLRGTDEPVTQRTTLPRGSVLVLYTDGLIEASRDVVAGDAALRSAFARPHVAHAKHAARALYDALLDGGAPRDDVAIITLEVERQREWSWHFNFVPGAADMELARISLARALDAADAADRHGAQIVFGELLANVVRHAPGPSEVRLICHDEEIALHVLDRGPGFDPDALPVPALLSESSRGLIIVRALATTLVIRPRADGGTHVVAGLARRAPSARPPIE